MQFVSVGFGSNVCVDRVVAVLNPDSAPIRRRIQEAKEAHELIDATYGRKIRAVLIMDSGHVMVTAIAPDTLVARMNSETMGGD